MYRIVSLPLALVAASVSAQDIDEPAVPGASVFEQQKEDEDQDPIVKDEILVVATPWHSESVDTPQAPIITLDEEDVASYGASSLSELLEALAPQTGSGRGRGGGGPVILLNGQRISSFREIRDIPPEAIRRMEVLPEEVALKYGYPATQRVVNFILKDKFASKTIAGEYNLPTLGGFAESELEAGTVRINKQNRLNLHAKLEDSSMLTEAERKVIQQPGTVPSVGSDPDPAAYRSLVDDSRELTLNGTWSTALAGGRGGSLSINGAFTRADSRGLRGLDTAQLVGPDGSSALRSFSDPLVQDVGTTTIQTGITLNKPISGWDITATLDASHSESRTDTDREADTSALVAAAAAGLLAVDGPLPALAPGGFDRARSKDLGITSLITVSGTPFRLPAGKASLTVKTGFNYTRSDNETTRNGGQETLLTRSDFSAGINLALPLTSRREKVLDAVGDITLNLSAGLNRISSFGTLFDWSAGLTWSPTQKLNFQASYFVDAAAPSLAQLGNPEVLSFNRTVYDFTRGETALVTILSGGNPDLKRERQRDLKLGLNWELPVLRNSNIMVEYFRNRSSDVTQSFPLLTPAIEAAFPDRVVRDGAGRLVSIDQRPVTFSEIKSSRMRWGFNLSGGIGKPIQGGSDRRPNLMGALRESGQAGGPGGGGAPGGGGGMGAGPRGPGGPGGFGGGGFGRGPGGRGPGGNGQGRWNISIFHTIRFSESVLVAPGGPALDLLEGDALSAGGVARHSFQMEGGAFYRGFGLRLNGNWSAPTHVRGSGVPGSSDLRFGSVLVLDARLFVNFDQRKSWVEKAPILKGMRLSFEVNNILNSRQKVTDENGLVPLSYQADYRDPRGRFVGIDIRKMF